MNSEPTFVKLLGLFVGTGIAISVALGAGSGAVGVVSGVALGVLVGASTIIAAGSPRTARSGFRLVLAGLALVLALILLMCLLARSGSLGEFISFGATLLGLGLLGSLMLLAAHRSRAARRDGRR